MIDYVHLIIHLSLNIRENISNEAHSNSRETARFHKEALRFAPLDIESVRFDSINFNLVWTGIHLIDKLTFFNKLYNDLG